MVEGARLESVYTGNRIEGSNPSDSANLISDIYMNIFIFSASLTVTPATS